MESSFLTPWYFFCFLYLVCKLFKGLFQSLCLSVNCTSWVFESWNIPRRCHVTKALIYICNFVVLLFMESSICIVCTISNFSGLKIVKILSVNYVLHFESVKIYKHCLCWNVFSTDIYGKIVFNYLLLFKPFLLVSKLWELSLTCSETEARCIFEGF